MTNDTLTKKPKVSIVIPTYKGEKSIAKLVDQLVSEFADTPIEIIIVNDASPDQSHEICINIQKKHPSLVHYLRLGKNVGEHSAVMAGLNHAISDYVVVVDDDLQNPPGEVLKLFNYTITNKYDVVYTSYSRKKHPRFRNWGSKFNDISATLLLGKPKLLYLSSFKCMTRYVVEEIIKYKGPFPYIDGLLLKCTDNIGILEVAHYERSESKSGYTLKKLFQLWMNMAFNFSFLPLRISFFLGLFISSLGFGYAIYTFVNKLYDPSLPTGWASLIILISVFSGVQLILLGVIGEFLGKVLMSINQFPQYSVKEYFSSRERKKNKKKS